MALKGTYSAKPKDINKDWFVVDAEGLVLGRLAVIIAVSYTHLMLPTILLV